MTQQPNLPQIVTPYHDSTMTNNNNCYKQQQQNNLVTSPPPVVVTTTSTTTLLERSNYHHHPSHLLLPLQGKKYVKKIKPRYLFFSVYMLLGINSGRFMAPFLEHECHFTSKVIGISLSIKLILAIPAMLYGGYYADKLEVLYPSYGRAIVVLAGSLAGTILFALHGVKHLVPTSMTFFDSLFYVYI